MLPITHRAPATAPSASSRAGGGASGTGRGLPESDLPTAFGRFLLLKRLSRGGMGEIFLAKVGEIEGFEKLLIIKKILPNLVENQDFIARFVDEAQVAIKLNHANIAAVYEVGRVEGEYFLAIEYVEGRDLRRLVQRCREQRVRLPVDLCLFLSRELAAGLAYAHRRTDATGKPLELVHCDISPPNVMVSFEGEVKVIDFGIARSALRTAGSNPNMGFGKFGYMAPEQLLRGGVIDRRTDIYAAGVVLYELLTGERLYQFPEGTDYRQIARTVCQGQYAPPSQRDPALDPGLDAIVARALAVAKEDRYQAAEEFRDALQAKMYQMNPTISADSLARVMRDLFGTEREREQQELASLRAFDLGAFQEELAGSMNHTVTFARHSEPAAPPGGVARAHMASRPSLPPSSLVGSGQARGNVLPLMPSLPSLGDSSAAAQRAGSVELADGTRMVPVAETSAVPLQGAPVLTLTPTTSVSTRSGRGQASTTRQRVLPLLALVLLISGAVTTWILVRAQKGDGADGPVAISSPPPPKLLPELKPEVKALPEPAVEVPVAPVPDPKRPRVRKPEVKRVAEPPDAVVDEPPKGPSAQSVEAKFRQVGREYEEFKRSFGGRLEDRWQQILQDAAMGRRDQRLDDMLNQLRSDMKRIVKTSQ